MPTWLWPGWDAVWPNILASLIWAIPGAIAHLHTRRKLRHLHHAHTQLIDHIKGEPTHGDTK